MNSRNRIYTINIQNFASILYFVYSGATTEPKTIKFQRPRFFTVDKLRYVIFQNILVSDSDLIFLTNTNNQMYRGVWFDEKLLKIIRINYVLIELTNLLFSIIIIAHVTNKQVCPIFKHVYHVKQSQQALEDHGMKMKLTNGIFSTTK